MTQTPPTDTPAGVTPNGNGTTPTTTPPPAGQAQTPTPPQTWDEWLAGQAEAERATIARLYESKNSGLMSALERERDERKTLQKQLRDMAKGADAGSDVQTQLTAIADQLAAAERRADFFRDASKPDVGLSDAEGAWAIANSRPDDYFDKRGNLNVALLKERHPGLFAQPRPTPRANAGSGTQQPDQNGGMDMNTAIRRMAGRQ